MGKASASLFQRKFRIGYSRAASIIDALEDAEVIGPANGSKPREVLISKKQYAEMIGHELPEVDNDFDNDDSREYFQEDDEDEEEEEEEEEELDDLFEEAKELAVKKGKISSAMLQRHFRIGYSRAASIIDTLEENKIIGPLDGAKPRKVLV